MSLTYAECLALVPALQTALVGKTLLRCVAVGSRRFFFAFGESDDSVAWLHLCVQNPWLRFHLAVHSPQEAQPAKALNTQLQGKKVVNVSLLGEDRVLNVDFGERQLRFELFPRRPNLYVLDSNETILWSLNPLETSQYQVPLPREQELLEPVSVTHEEIERRYWHLEREAEFQKEKQDYLRRLRRKLKGAAAEECRVIAAAKDAEAWPEKQHEADLLKSHFHLLKRGVREVTVPDWEAGGRERILIVDPTLTPQENLQRAYKAVRKLKGTLEHRDRRLQQIQKHAQEITQRIAELEAIERFKELHRWALGHGFKAAPASKAITKKPGNRFRTYRTASGLEIYVGKTARDNDTLSFSVGRGSDWWFHVSDFPGGHVVLRLARKDQKPDPEAIEDALQVALRHSKAKARGEAEVIISRCKYLARAGAPGRVTVSQHQRRLVREDPERYRALADRS